MRNKNCGKTDKKNILCSGRLQVARVPSVLLTQRLTRILWVNRGESASCVGVCRKKLGRARAAVCVWVGGSELASEARKTTE